MKAILHTRCGCSREEKVTEPAPHDFVVTMRVDKHWVTDENPLRSQPIYQKRRFVRVNTIPDWTGVPVAHYLEELH